VMGKIVPLFNEDDFVTCEVCEKKTDVESARMDADGEVWICPTCFEYGSSLCDCEIPTIEMGDEYSFCQDCGRLIKDYYKNI
jgi:hypothetical protein